MRVYPGSDYPGSDYEHGLEWARKNGGGPSTSNRFRTYGNMVVNWVSFVSHEQSRPRLVLSTSSPPAFASALFLNFFFFFAFEQVCIEFPLIFVIPVFTIA